MSDRTVRIGNASHKKLQEISKVYGMSMTVALDEAIEEYRRKKFLEEVNEQYAKLRADPEAWKEECKERALWDNTLLDGLDDE